MGFKEGTFPPVDPETFLDKPLMERMKTLALHWCEYGFGTPKMVHTIYVVKLVVFYTLGGLSLILATSDLPAFWHVSEWWAEPIVYQKAVMWTMLLEAIGIAGSWGPLAGKFKPMTGGIRYWARPGTIRMPPYKAVPFTAGNTRTVADAVLYLGFLVSLLVGDRGARRDDPGLVRPALLIAPIVLLVLNGLRDKIVFLAARSEQYLPALIFFAVFDFVDMIVALKLLIVVVWIGAGVSKFGHHFAQVVAADDVEQPVLPCPRGSGAPSTGTSPRTSGRPRWRTSSPTVGGTLIEIVTPLVLLFSTNRTVTALAVIVMVIFHFFIISAFPLAVPLEWNVLFAYATVFLFWGFKAGDGFGIGDMTSPALTLAVVAGLVFFPILGQPAAQTGLLPAVHAPVRRQLGLGPVGLPAGRRVQAERPHPEQRQPGRPAPGPRLRRQDRRDHHAADDRLAVDAQPGPRPLLAADEARPRPRQGARCGRPSSPATRSSASTSATGTSTTTSSIAEVQRRCGFEPGEWIVVWVESQPIHKPTQEYMVIDAALGVIERGTWNVAEAVDELPWLPNGPIPAERDLEPPSRPRSTQPEPAGHRPAGRPGHVTKAVVVGSGPNGLVAAALLARAGLEVDGSGGRRRDRRRHQDRRGDRARAAARPVLGGPPDGGGLPGPPRPRPRPARALLVLARDRLRPSPRRRRRGACCTARSTETAAGLGADGPRWKRLFAGPSAGYDLLSEDILGPLLRLPAHPVRLARFGTPTLLPAVGARPVLPHRGGPGAVGRCRRPRLPSAGPAPDVGDRPRDHHRRPPSRLARGRRRLVVDQPGAGPRPRRARRQDRDRGARDLGRPAARRRHHHLRPGARRRGRDPGRPPPGPHRQGLPPLPARTRGLQGRLRRRGRRPLGQRGRPPGRHRPPRRPLRGSRRAPSGRSTPAACPSARSCSSPSSTWPTPSGPRATSTRSGATPTYPPATRATPPRRSPPSSNASRPGFRDRIVGTAVRTTTEMSRYNPNFVGGDILTGAKTVGQMLLGPRRGRNPYDTGVPGMYLCSAATPPGPGAHGMCGFHAATLALRRLRP